MKALEPSSLAEIRAARERIAGSVLRTPLVRIADEMNRRYVILTFGFADSNLAFAPAFPVLIGNALDWLGGQANGLSRPPSRIFLPAKRAACFAARRCCCSSPKPSA